jgi:hypothetical protein
MFVRKSAYSLQSYLARRSVKGLPHIRWLGTAKLNNPTQASAVHISNVSGDDSKQSGEPINLDHCIQLFKENKFPEIVNEWENVKKFTRKLSLNEEVLSVLASSADKAGKANLVIGMFDFAKAHNLDVVDPSIYESYIIECAKNPPKYWMKAHNIVEAIASTDSKPSLPQSVKLLCFEEAVKICSVSGKWRTALEIIGKMRLQPFGLTPTALKAALSVCCHQTESTPVKAALSLFMYLHKHNIHRDVNMYLDLLRALDHAQKFDEVNEVWRLLLSENFNLQQTPQETDQLFAYRIDGFFKSDHPSGFEDAMLTFDSVCEIIVTPRFSAQSVYKGLLAMENFEGARQFVERVEGMGKKMKFPRQLFAKHVIALCDVGEYDEAASFLLGLRKGSIQGHSDGSISTVQPALWQHVLSGLIRGHNPGLAVKVFDAICDLRLDTMKTPTAARNDERKRAEEVVLHVFPEVIEMLGKDRRWQQALTIVTQCVGFYHSLRFQPKFALCIVGN